jgi:hypothetical protein
MTSAANSRRFAADLACLLALLDREMDHGRPPARSVRKSRWSRQLELEASNGSLVAEITDDSNPSDDFNIPVGVDADDSHVWVTNVAGNSVTELAHSDRESRAGARASL